MLVHGGRFNKESWEKQARVLANAGFRVVSIDSRPGEMDRLVLFPFQTDQGERVMREILNVSFEEGKASRVADRRASQRRMQCFFTISAQENTGRLSAKDTFLMPRHSGVTRGDQALPLVQGVRWPSWWANSDDRRGIGREAAQTHA